MTATADIFHYESEAFSESHPARMAAVGKLFGLECANVERASVLEIGCASGGNIFPMAMTLPAARFVGLDISVGAIAEAERIKQELSLANISFVCADINSIHEPLGAFDYIIVHGLYSWVDPRTQEKLLKLCQSNLAAHGLVYLSFNVFPGWHPRIALREMILLEIADISGPRERLAQARRFMDAMSIVWKTSPSPETGLLRTHLEFMRSLPDWFLAHDLLSDENRPCYLVDLVRAAERYDFQYVGDANLWKMAPFDLAPESAAFFRENVSDAAGLEQRLDFARAETFRNSIFCRSGEALQRDTAILRLPELLLSADLKLISTPGSSPAKFQGQRGTELESSDDIVTRALILLSDRWPASIGFETLAGLLGLHPSPENSRQAAVLIQGLFRLLLAGQVIPSTWSPPIAGTISETPQAFRYARYQSEQRNRLTSLLHSTVELDPSSSHLLRLLDGSRNLQKIKEKLSGAKEGADEQLLELLEAFRRLGLLIDEANR